MVEEFDGLGDPREAAADARRRADALDAEGRHEDADAQRKLAAEFEKTADHLDEDNQ
jgi:hypothetical protein